MSVRIVLIGLAVAFAVYQALRGIIWTSGTGPEYPWVLWVALLCYLLVTVLAVFAQPRQEPGEEPRSEPMPMWAALLAFVAAIALPTLTGIAVGGGAVRATYGTWFVGGLGALMVVVMVRRRPWIAWLGTVALVIGAMAWLGALQAFGQGLVGSIMWVGIAQLVVMLIDRAERDASQLGELQAMTSAWEAAQEGRERERRVQVQRALAVGGPILERVIAMHGALSASERRAAGIAEAKLRDELRGPRLLDDAVRAQIDVARHRGSQVSVFDEGGLDDLTDEALQSVREQLAAALVGVRSQRIIIRSSPHDRVVITVVGRSRVDGDDDVVDLWREIEAPEH